MAFASYDRPLPPMTTLMLVASAMTWLFVRISPVDEISMPVPAARPFRSVVLMLTIAGSTFWAIALTSIEPVPVPDEPLLEPFGFVPVFGWTRPALNGVVFDPSCTATAMPAPIPADARTSAMVATIARPRLRVVDVGAEADAGADGGQPGVGAAQPGGGPHPPPPPAGGTAVPA